MERGNSATDEGNDVGVSVRSFNTLVRFLDNARSRYAFSIEPMEVLRIAAKRSGLVGFHCQEFDEPLSRLCNTLKDPHRSPLGRLQRKSQIVAHVTNRLLIEKALRADPNLIREPIDHPWFVMGLPRSGMTLLHRLLACDPANRAPLLWEASFPLPRHDRDTAARRLKEVDRGVRFMQRMSRKSGQMHELGAALPEECGLLLANGLTAGPWLGGPDDFNKWFYACDKTRAYELHKIQLQILQRSCEPKRWVLKAPEHLLNIKWLLKVYPQPASFACTAIRSKLYRLLSASLRGPNEACFGTST